jgi:NAD(P)-dependent dehydrogenase (short-subunit alcohol dehydrogenase family)
MKGLGVLSLEGKRALITGGGTGLGRSLARGFAEAGAEVVICGRRREPLEETRSVVEAAGGSCEIVVADVTVEADVERLRDAAGRIDILVNNAGISPDEAWETVSLDSWREVFDTNLFAPFRLCQVFGPGMRERGWGRIINIASVYGSIAGKPFLYPEGWDPSSYFASKHAVHGLTRNLAVRLAPYGVCVNSLSPGGISGATNRGLTADEQVEAAAAKTPEQREAEAARGARFLHDEIPMGRVGDPDDYTGPAVFLASPGAAYVTGQNLIVDGGWTVW